MGHCRPPKTVSNWARIVESPLHAPPAAQTHMPTSSANHCMRVQMTIPLATWEAVWAPALQAALLTHYDSQLLKAAV
jgi:hypothetical protein